MRNFLTLLRHEIRSLLISPATYLAAVFFLLVMGFMYQFILETFNQTPQDLLPSTLFLNAFFIPVFFLVPLITMKSIAEERRMGILDSLLSTPVNTIELVLSKFCAAYGFYTFLYLLTLAYPFITYYFFPDQRIIDPASLIGGYAFVCLSGMVFVSIGIFTSALTRSQLVAGIFSFTVLFGLIIGTRYLADLSLMQSGDYPTLLNLVEYIQIYDHMEDFSRGILDTRPFFLYTSSTLVVLSLAVLAVDHKR